MSGADIAIGAGEGALAGASTGAAIGGWVGAIVGGVVGAAAGTYKGVKVSDEKDQLEANQEQAADTSKKMSESQAREKAAALQAQAAAAGTSGTMFKLNRAEQQSRNDHAAIRDTGNKFSATDDKAAKLAYNYGKPSAVRKTA